MRRGTISTEARRVGGGSAPVVAGLLYFLLSAAAMLLAVEGGGVSALWPANALLVAMLLLRPRGQWGSMILAGFVGGVLATMLVRGFTFTPILFAAANMLEVTIAARAIHRDAARDRRLAGSVRSMGRLTLWAGVVAPAASGLIGALTLWGLMGQAFWTSYILWFLADALSLLIFTPFFFALLCGEYRDAIRAMTPRGRVEAVVLLVFMISMSISVFLPQRPMLFFLVMPMMLISFRLGWIGAMAASVCAATVGTIATMAGYGPIVPLSPDPDRHAFYLQIFFLTQLLTQWPVIAALQARDALTDRLAQSERSLRMLAAQSAVLMMTFDVEGRCGKVVGAPGLLPTRDVDALPGVFIDDLTADAVLRPVHEMALDVPDRFHRVEFSVVDACEEGDDVRWLEATFRALEDEDGRCPGTLMTLHDVSVRKQQTLALARSAHTDSLTGLLNRAGFMARLDRWTASPPPGVLSLAVIDVDRFKLINDNCGHQTGDVVLQEVARRIAGEVRAGDAVGRMGGDEFVILLSSIDWMTAQDIAARVVQAVGAEPVRLPSGETITAAISCGVARREPADTAEAFLKRADMALYDAKRAGRNRMVAA